MAQEADTTDSQSVCFVFDFTDELRANNNRLQRTVRCAARR
jgi:hypothetical protein